MRDLIWLCTTVERPDANVSTIVERPGVIKVHARILPLTFEQILNYQAVMGSQNAVTREVAIRNPPDVKVDKNHWVYKITGPDPMWMKVVGVTNIRGAGRFLLLHCSVETVNDKRSDPATQESPPQWETPGYPVTDRI